MKKKEVKEETKQTKKEKVGQKKLKKDKKVKKENFFVGVKNELKKVKWPDKKYIIKYSIVTIVFVLMFSLFFYLITGLFQLLKVWLG